MGQRDLFKQITNKQALFGFFGAAVLLFSMIASTIASAETLSVMSITPSSASVTAGDEVQYSVEFTPEESAGAFVIDFCSNTPLLGQSCTPPTGMDVSNVTSSGGVTILSATDNKIVATKTITAPAAQTILLEDITNPSVTGVAYARIITYVDGTAAALYESDDPSNGDLDVGGAITPLDNGSVAMYFNNDVSVSGTVLETMTFCVSSSIINPGCTGIVAPSVKLGQETAPGSGIYALQPGVLSEGSLHTQMNTNAANGAVVRLKSSAPCGGLMRSGSTECDIEASGAGNVLTNDNTARVGVKLAAATTAPGAVNPIGTIRPYDDGGGAFYDTTNYKFNFDDDDIEGITSTLGDPFLDTDSLPATNQNMALTFAATIGTNTPAGLYSTDLNLIAVGKF